MRHRRRVKNRLTIHDIRSYTTSTTTAFIRKLENLKAGVNFINILRAPFAPILCTNVQSQNVTRENTFVQKNWHVKSDEIVTCSENIVFKEVQLISINLL